MATSRAGLSGAGRRLRGGRRCVAAAAWAVAGCWAVGSALPAGQLQAQTTWRVGPDGGAGTLAEAVARAGAGDTVRVASGHYRGGIVVERPLVLLGEGWPVVDGGGRGHVLEARAPLVIRGFVLRGSGTRVDREDAGLMVGGAPAVVEGNRLEDVLFGIYLKDAAGSIVRGNRVRGKDLPPPRRGDGIRLWHSDGTRIEGNDVAGTRDVVVYFSDSLVVTENRVSDGRYGLHYMYSHHNRFERNRFVGNQVGAFIMYSSHIELRQNVFAEAHGPTGMGLGLKDADAVLAVDNLLVRNAVGVYLDNAPSRRDGENRFEANVLLHNGTGVRLMPSVRGNVLRGNAFVGNRKPAEVAGGAAAGQAAQNLWHGNLWDAYAGFDRDGDGVGDTPYVHARLADELTTRHPAFRLFTGSPALRLVDALSRFFPLLRPAPVVVDSAPRLASETLQRWRAAPPVPAPETGADGTVDAGERPRPVEAAGWGGLVLLSLGALWRVLPGRRSP